MTVHRRKILFLDDVFLRHRRNLHRKVNSAVKHPEPVMRVDAPWNTERDDFNYVNVIHDDVEGVFKMWYAVVTRKERGCAARTWAYATSEDGIDWHRPILGRVDINGSTENNYCLPPLYEFCWTMVHDPSDPPARRYKMIFTVDDGGGDQIHGGHYHVPLNLAYSADGLVWDRPVHVNPVLRGVSDAGFTLYYDRDRRKYVLFTRRVPNLPRDVSMYESFDLVNWEDRGRVLVAPDAHDPPSMFNLQTMTSFRYENFHLGLLNTHYTQPDAESYEVRHRPPEGTDSRLGLVDVQLAWSRDGQQWHRPEDRSAIVPNGEPGTPDAGIIFVPQSSPPVVDGTTWIYYTACPERHSIWDYRAVEDGGRRRRSCMLARMPEDHWVSLDAGDQEGVLVTQPIVMPDFQACLLNADVDGGAITGELVTPDGKVVDGFGRNDCSPVTGKCKDQPLRWRGDGEGSDTTVPRRPLCLRLYITRAKLYALTMTYADQDGGKRRQWENQRWCDVIAS